MSGKYEERQVSCTCPEDRGATVPISVWRIHKEIYAQQDDRGDGVDTEGTFKLTVPSTRSEPVSDYSYHDATYSILDGESASEMQAFYKAIALDDLIDDDDFVTPPPIERTSLGEIAVYKSIRSIDEKRYGLEAEIENHLEKLGGARREKNAEMVVLFHNSVLDDRRQLNGLVRDLNLLDVGSDAPNARFRNDVLQSVAKLNKKVAPYISEPTHSPPVAVSPDRNYFNMGSSMLTRLRKQSYLTLIPMLLVIVLSILDNMSSAYAKFSLSLLKVHTKAILETQRGNLSVREQRLVDSIPTDVRTVKRRMAFSPSTKIFAVCPRPNCSKIHKLEKQENGFFEFPRYCNNPLAWGRPCGQEVTMDIKWKGEVCTVARKPCHVQQLDHFKARFMADPFYEALLWRGQNCTEKDIKTDIKDGKRLSEIKGPDGKKFMAESDELHLAWNLSIDWGNPLKNKAAGKRISVGSVAATCLNLPPLYRYKMENVYLIMVIPGPNEPNVEEIIHYMDLIVDMFEDSYHIGTFYSSTYMHPEGILERSIIAAFVSDLPAARKCCGMVSYSSEKNPCHLCRITLSEINVIDQTKECWRPRDFQTFKENSTKWKEKKNITARKAWSTQTGVRWSPLLRLPYWNPLECVVIDGMHNLLLGVIKHHCMYILGFNGDQATDEDESFSDGRDDSLNVAQKEKAEKRIEKDRGDVPTNYLNSLLRPTLLALHSKYVGDQASSVDRDAMRKCDLSKEIKWAISSGQRPPASRHSDDDARSALDVLPRLEKLDDDSTPSVREIPRLSEDEKKKVQQFICETVRPRSHKGPPKTLGEKEHGKLKADQWRSAIEFDIPVGLASLWDESHPKYKLFRSSMLLAIAVQWATSHVTSDHHIQQYTAFMSAYLQSILEIDPTMRLKPNHHNSLHLGIYLKLFGPMHGWWMFVYERVAGRWQNINTNFKLGQMEETMLDGFSSAGNLKAFLNHSDAPQTVKEVAELLKAATRVDGRGSLFADQHSTAELTSDWDPRQDSKAVPLEEVIQNELKALEERLKSLFHDSNWLTPKMVNLMNSVTIRGQTFTSGLSSSSRVVFLPIPGGDLMPGCIHQIFSVKCRPNRTESGEVSQGTDNPVIRTFLVLRVFKSAKNVKDPFTGTAEFRDFKAGIWRKEMKDRPSIIPLVPTIRIYHGIMREWDESHYVLKALVRDS